MKHLKAAGDDDGRVEARTKLGNLDSGSCGSANNWGSASVLVSVSVSVSVFFVLLFVLLAFSTFAADMMPLNGLLSAIVAIAVAVSPNSTFFSFNYISIYCYYQL